METGDIEEIKKIINNRVSHVSYIYLIKRHLTSQMYEVTVFVSIY
jgi:hypothetical protein